MLTPRYASHRLRLGDVFARLVLIEALPQGQWRLTPFEGEVERTIFLSGELTFQREGMPTSAEATDEVSFAELASRLEGRTDWALYYEGRPLLP